MTLNPKGRDWGQLVNWDSLGQAYTAFIVVWTVILYSGVIWMIINRNLPSIKIRNVPIAISSVSLLHIYLLKICLAYTTNGNFACAAEFWIMSIYLPFGIALFQANLVQLHSISDQQKKLLSSAASSRSSTKATGLVAFWRDLPQLKRSYVYIGIGMVIQLVITAVLYATSPTLQGDWSSYGDVPHAKGQALCRKSLEWVPSAFWQLLWSWLFGLYTLYKIRNIRDTHYWRLGTWLSIISGLPGTPLWLAALYTPSFKPVNIRWVPPMWLAPGILVMQIVTIFFPIHEAYQSRKHMRTTLTLIKDWEERSNVKTGVNSSLYSDPASAQSFALATRSKEIFSMASLEKALVVNPHPLLCFAATKDFTAENIIFLMRVREWQEAWKNASRDFETRNVSSTARETLFCHAVEIYMTSVLDTTAEFPINIDCGGQISTASSHTPSLKARKELRWTVERSATRLFESEMKRMGLTRGKSDDSAETIWTMTELPKISSSWSDKAPTFAAKSVDDTARIFPPHPAILPLESGRSKISDDFDEHVWDAAQASIKYLVLTNTWRKFAATAQVESQLLGV